MNRFSLWKFLTLHACFLVLLVPPKGLAQEIVGYVLDEQGVSLPGASVYFDGTSRGASTDAKGFFRLRYKQKLQTPLVVSFIGKQSESHPNPYIGDTLRFVMKDLSTELREVRVFAHRFTREEMLKAFRREFLEDNRAGRVKISITHNATFSDNWLPL